MARPPSSQPTDVELQILRVLWESGPCTAREVHKTLAADKQTNYSTTVKMLAVMFDKGMVTRDEAAYPMTFSAAVSQQQTQQTVLGDVIRKLYDGSAKSLVMQVLSSQESSAADLAEIRRLIEQLDTARPVPSDRSKKRR